MRVRLYARLRQIAATREVDLPVGAGQRVGDVLQALVKRFPGLQEAVWRADGSLAGHVAVLLNGRDIRHLDGVDTPVTEDDWLDVFPPVGGGADGEVLTRVKLKFAGDFFCRVGKGQTEFEFGGNTLRELMAAVMNEFGLADLLMEGDEPKPYLQLVIDGRLWYAVGGWEAPIQDGAMVVLFLFGGASPPVPLPRGTTVRELSAKRTARFI